MQKKSLGTFAIGFACLVGACDLGEIEVPEGEPVVVVHAVMRPDREYQFVVVEHSFSGSVDAEFGHGITVPTRGSPRLPIEEAVVEVRNLDLPDDSCGNPVRFEHDMGIPGVTPFAGVYWAPAMCPTMRPGDRLELTVETVDGDTVTGMTRIPGMDTASLEVLGEVYPLGMDTVLTFNRDRDALRVHINPISGRLIQIEVMRTGDLDLRQGMDVWPGARLFADTMDVTVPGDLVDASGFSEGNDVFRAGRRYMLRASVTDSNYYDFGRSKNNKFTGRGLINHLDGGMGVFGSLAGASIGLRTEGVVDDEREGIYLLNGEIQGITVAARLTVYTARSNDVTELSGYLDGDWLYLGTGAEGVSEWKPWSVENREVNGTLDGVGFHIIHIQRRLRGMGRVSLKGDFKVDGAFTFGVSDSLGINADQLGTLLVRRP